MFFLGLLTLKNMEHRAVTSFARLACPRMFFLGATALEQGVWGLAPIKQGMANPI